MKNQIQTKVNVQTLREKAAALKVAREELKTLKLAHKEELAQARKTRMEHREELKTQREAKRVATVIKLEAKLALLKAKVTSPAVEQVGAKKIKADKKPSKVIVSKPDAQTGQTTVKKAKAVKNTKNVSMAAANVNSVGE